MIVALLLALNLIFDSGAAISVCDNVDIFFLIDKDSLIHNYHGVQSIVEAIIEDGASEEAAFSLKIYGDQLTDYQLSLQLELTDTFETYRKNKTDTILERLDTIYNDIMSSPSSFDTVHNILLSDIFDVASKEYQPTRQNGKAVRFSDVYGVHKIGGEDDNNRYFIFDHFNKLVATSDTEQDRAGDYEICELFKYISSHDDESIHFIMGQQYKNMKDSFNTICNNKHNDLYHDDLFFYLNKTIDNYDNEDNDHLENLENLFHLSCPAHMEQPEFNGYLQFRAHTQWIDSSTISKCDLSYLPNKDGYAHDLDPKSSYIYVTDHLYDHNTFKEGYFLMADPLAYHEIKQVGCDEAVYKIVKIKKIKQKKQNKFVSKLKLYVELPESPMDYMLDVDMTMENIKPIETYHIDMKSNRMNPIPEDTTFTIERQDEFKPPDENEESDEFYRGYNEKTTNVKTNRKRALLKYYKRYEETDDTKPLLRSVTMGHKKVQWKDLIESDSPDTSVDSQHKISFKPITEKKATKSKPGLYQKFKSSWVGRSLGKLKRTKSHVDGFIELPSWEASLENSADTADTTVAVVTPLWSHPWNHKKDLVTEVIGATLKLGPFKVQAQGTIDAGWDVNIKLDVGYKGEFKWTQLFKRSASKVKMKVQVVGTVEVTAKFTFKITAALTLQATPFSVGKTIWAAAGPVPVIFKPYFKLHLELKIPTFSLTYVAECKYKSVITLGYDYRGKKATDTATEITSDPTEQTSSATKGWTKDVTTTEKRCTTTLTLTSGENGPCDLDIGFTISIIPIIGVRFYYILGVEGEFKVSLPIRYNIKIPNGLNFCENKEKEICEEKPKLAVTTKMYAAKYWAIELHITGRVYIMLPNFFGILKQAYALKKLFKKIGEDIIDIGNKLEEHKEAFEDVCRKVLKALTDLKNGEKTAVQQVLEAYNALNQFVSDTKGLAKDIKATIKKRVNQLWEFYLKVRIILQSPLSISKHALDFNVPKIELKKYEPTTGADCIEVPAILKKIVKVGCCADGLANDLKKDYTWAHRGGFGDWYDGYDRYLDDDEYDEYGRYVDGGRYGKQSLNSAPIVEPQSYNPFLALLLLDIFTIFGIIFCCCTAFIGLACGAFAFYNYNKFTIEKGYNPINIEQDEV